MSVPDQKSRVDRLLDVFVFAPLGLVFNLDEVLPELVEKGHEQVKVARLFGKFAIDRGSKRVGPIVEQAGGLVSRAAPTARAAPAVPATGLAAVPPLLEDPVTGEPVPAADSLGITDYDALSASQVVPRLDGLAQEELDAVRRYEHANRGRKTILSKIAQLQA
jgi:hypothetical protein